MSHVFGSKKNLLSTLLLPCDGYKCISVCVCACAARGNTTVCGEFNFVADPEAAFIVLDRYTCPTHIASWEFSCANSLPWVKEETVCSKLIFHSSPPPRCRLWWHFSIPHNRSGVSGGSLSGSQEHSCWPGRYSGHFGSKHKETGLPSDASEAWASGLPPKLSVTTDLHQMPVRHVSSQCKKYQTHMTDDTYKTHS